MTQAASPQPAVWDRHAIKAEINRRNMTLTGIARDAGLPEAACRKALFGLDRKGADAIADALGIPFDTLFPAGFIRSRSSHAKPTAKPPAESRKKRVRTADTARVRT